MQSSWGDDIDEELASKEKIRVGFLFNYLRMSQMIKRIEEETGEWDDQYPKSELMKIWGCAIFMMLLLVTFSYNILIIATGLFYFFYGHILLQVYGVWKRFRYSKAAYWGMTLAAIAGTLALGIFLQTLIFD